MVHLLLSAAAASSWAAIAGAPALLEMATYRGSAAFPEAPRNQSDNSATPTVVQSRRIVNGSSRYDNATATYTVAGIGVDIWETIDDFHFAHKALHGDGSITARIDSIEDVHQQTKAGLMIRNSLDATSENVMVLVTPRGGVSVQHRHTNADRTYRIRKPEGTIQLPHWIRLTRRGNRFIGEHSSDGANWQTVLPSRDPNQASSIEVSMNDTVYVGLAVTSHDPSRMAEAHISNVTIIGSASPAGPFDHSQDICFEIPPLRDNADGTK